MPTVTQYSPIAKILYWLIAGLIISQYVLAKLAENAEHSGNDFAEFVLMSNHKSFGVTILMLAVLRLLWRLFNKPPALPTGMPAWQQRASNISRWPMYVLIFAIPISGWLFSSAADQAAGWIDRAVEQLLPAYAVAGAVVTTQPAIGILAAVSEVEENDDKNGEENVGLKGVALALPIWNIDYPNSTIEFFGVQDGEPFEGEWRQWQAAIQFNPGHPELGRFDVVIDSASAVTGDQVRDDYIVTEEFFDAAHFPQIHFLADHVRPTSERKLEAIGKLTMKGLTRPATLTFQVEEDGRKMILTGTATLDRFNWNIGTGDWAGTISVGKDVGVKVTVVATN